MTCWALKCCASETGRVNIDDKPDSGRPTPVSDEKQRQRVDELTQSGRRAPQQRIANLLCVSRVRV